MSRRKLDAEAVLRMYEAEKKTIQEICAAMQTGYLQVARILRGRVKIRRTGPRDRNHIGRERMKHVRDKAGYLMVLRPEHPYANKRGYIREHRIVMEAKLGRYLLPHEDVHHKDKDKSNNNPDNLEIHTRSQHIRIHNLDRSSAKSLRQESSEVLQSLYATMTSGQIAHRYGTSPASVQRLMLERGIHPPQTRRGRHRA